MKARMAEFFKEEEGQPPVLGNSRQSHKEVRSKQNEILMHRIIGGRDL